MNESGILPEAKSMTGGLEYLNERAKAEFKEAVDRYAEALLKEASRLESATKSTAGKPEITSTMVKDADILLRRGYTHPRKQVSLIAAQLVATVGGFFTGILADATRLKEPSGLAIFVVVLTITTASAVITVVKE